MAKAKVFKKKFKEESSSWDKIELDSDLIIREGENTYLISIPKTDYRFWFPKKCCNVHEKGEELFYLSFNDDFTFHIFKTSINEDGGFDNHDERELTADEFKAEFFNK